MSTLLFRIFLFVFRISFYREKGAFILNLQKTSFLVFLFAVGAIVVLRLLERWLYGRFLPLTAVTSKRKRAFERFVKVLFSLFYYSLVQLLLTLCFAVCYVLFIRNGVHPDAGDLGVVFVFVEALVSGAAVWCGLFSASAVALLPSALHSGFLAYKWFACALKYGAGGSSKYLGYILFNPVFGFIGAPYASWWWRHWVLPRGATPGLQAETGCHPHAEGLSLSLLSAL